MKPPVVPTHPALRFPEHGLVESAVDWLFDPLNPKRVDEAVLIVVLLGAMVAGPTGVGLACLWLYGRIAFRIAQRTRRWLASRRVAKGAAS